MSLFSVPNIKYSGLAACVPKTEVSNMDYKWISEKERKLYIKTTGIAKRRVVSKGTTTSDLCFHAAEQLIKDLGWKKEEIGLLIFISQSNDYILPATGIVLQDRLGLPKTSLAFDINLGCSGYVYGLSVAGSLMTTSKIQKALLLVGDVSSATASYRDKSTYALFGDAATATALEYDNKAKPIQFNLQSDGSGFEALIIHEGGLRNFVTKKSLEYKKYGDGIYRKGIQVSLNGIDIFNFSMREVSPNIKELVETYNQKILDDYDYYILHQANLLMNNSIRRKLKQDKNKFPISIDKFGNTSSASIPLTMVSELKDKLRSEKLNLILSGFGVGLSWGSVSLETNKIICSDLVEV